MANDELMDCNDAESMLDSILDVASLFAGFRGRWEGTGKAMGSGKAQSKVVLL